MKKGLRKVLVIVGVSVLSLVLFLAWYMTSNGEIHLIPKNYEGVVVIVFNVADGVPEKHEDRKRVYEIPDNGILRTQFKFNDHWVASSYLQYYYVSKSGERERIPYPDRVENLSSDVVQVFSKSAGDNASSPENPYIIYLVGKYEEADSLSRLKESFPF